MTTHDSHKTLLDYVYQYGANFKIRLVYNHIIVVTEVRPCEPARHVSIGRTLWSCFD